MRKSIEKALRKKMNQGGRCYMEGGEVLGAAGGGAELTDADFAEGASVQGEKMDEESVSSDDIGGKKTKSTKMGMFDMFKGHAPVGFKPMAQGVGMADGGMVENVARGRRARKQRSLGIAEHLKKKMGYK